MRTSFNWPQLWPKAPASAAIPHEQGSAVINQLRELRATLAGHTARLDRVEEHVVRIDGQLHDIHLLIARALDQGAARDQGAAGRLSLSNPGDGESSEGIAVGQRRADGRKEDRAEDRLEERVSDIERRLARVEDRLDG